MPTVPQALIPTLALAALVAASAPAIPACNIVDGKGYGDCAGIRISNESKGHLTVRSHRTETAIIDGATVLKGGALELLGVSTGDITVHQGGKLHIAGVVSGTVTNLGGTVEVEGVVDHLRATGGRNVVGGVVGSVSGEGAVNFKKGAVLGGEPLEKAVRKEGNK
jgi:hypothetical protein